MDIRSGQKLAWENKVAKGFNTTNVPLEFCLLSLAEMTGVDLQDQIEAKMVKNAARVYQRLPNGVLAKGSGEVG